MRKKKTFRLVLMLLILAFLVIQFIPVDRSVPEYDPSQDFFARVDADAEMMTLIKNACYDCHSYETEYPWYAYVAPVSRWIQGHVNHAREHLNFSVWGTYDSEKSDHKLEECVEMVEDGKMPLSSFTRLGRHPEARLTDDQRDGMVSWFEKLRE